MWQTECTVGTLNVDVANKIILKMPRQHKIMIKKDTLASTSTFDFEN